MSPAPNTITSLLSRLRRKLAPAEFLLLDSNAPPTESGSWLASPPGSRRGGGGCGPPPRRRFAGLVTVSPARPLSSVRGVAASSPRACPPSAANAARHAPRTAGASQPSPPPHSHSRAALSWPRAGGRAGGAPLGAMLPACELGWEGPHLAWPQREHHYPAPPPPPAAP